MDGVGSGIGAAAAGAAAAGVAGAGPWSCGASVAEAAEPESFSAANSVFKSANSAFSASMRWRKSAGLDAAGELDELAVLVTAVSLPPPGSPADKRVAAWLAGATSPTDPNAKIPKHTP